MLDNFLPAPLKQSLLLLSLFTAFAGVTSPVRATEYHIVVPAPGKEAPYAPIKLEINPASLPVGSVGIEYSGFNFVTTLRITGDSELDMRQVSWLVYSGSLPSGLSLTKDGSLTGTPIAEATSGFQVMAKYKTKTALGTYSIVIKDFVLSLNAHLPNAQPNRSYQHSLSSSFSVNGDPLYDSQAVVWSVTEGDLPLGVSLSADGEISGTPLKAGLYPLTVQASYKGRTISQVLALEVAWTEAEIVLKDGSRQYEDGKLAYSCQDYRQPAGIYRYQGQTGSGVYKVKPGDMAAFDVYCDMNFDGGGWTLLIGSKINGGAWLVGSEIGAVVPESNKYVAPLRATSLAARGSSVLISDARNPSYYVKSHSTYPIERMRQGNNMLRLTPGSASTDWDLSHLPPGAEMGWLASLDGYATEVPLRAWGGYPNVYWSANVGEGLHLGLELNAWKFSAGLQNNSLSVWVR